MDYNDYVEQLNDPRRTAIGVFGPIPSGAYYVTVPAPSPRRPGSAVSGPAAQARRARPRTTPAPALRVPDARTLAADRLERDAELSALRQRFHPVPPGWAPARSA